MVSKKRSLEEASSPRAKKIKPAKGSADKKERKEKKAGQKAEKLEPLQHTIVPEEIDFPRGGGTSYTPQEVKAIRAEAIQEAEEELFKVRELCHSVYALIFTGSSQENAQKTKKARRKSDAKGKGKAVDDGEKKANAIRIEHLNYKVRRRRPWVKANVDISSNSALLWG
jgi:rRNA biogenesis protein RRP5